MPIFIPLFIAVFIVVPLFLTHWAADMLGARRWRMKLLLLVIIGALNWQVWQAPKLPERQRAELNPAKFVNSVDQSRNPAK